MTFAELTDVHRWLDAVDIDEEARRDAEEMKRRGA
jgi:hypothetical protein